MKTLDNLFSKKIEIVAKLKENVSQIFYKKILFDHLGPELKKIYDKKKDKVYYKKFYEASQYEYGLFDKDIDLLQAYLLYKKYADRNDYFCMYKMHVIHLCEYAKFHVPFSRVLEKIYLLKCYAYLPKHMIDNDLKLFRIIDVKNEISEMLKLEDESFEKHEDFFKLLDKEREIYNLTENDIKLMKGVILSFFIEDVGDEQDTNSFSLAFSTLNSLKPKTQLDYAYYNAKIKSIYFQERDNIISEVEIEKLFKEIEGKKLYEFFYDYGYYLLKKIGNPNPKIIEIFTYGTQKGYTLCCLGLYENIINYYDFSEIMENYDKIIILLDCLLDAIIFEKLLLNSFILLMGYLNKYSKFSKNIISYLKYVKDINDYITPILKNKDRQRVKEPFKENEINFFQTKAYIYFFGFKGIEEQNFKKAIEYFKKALDHNDNNKFLPKEIKFFEYKIKHILNSRKLVSNDELSKAKKELYEYNSKNLLKNEIMGYYLLGKDYFEGITKKKDGFISFKIYESGQNILCSNTIECFLKHEIKQFLKNHEDKYQFKFKDELCCICYDEKVNKLLLPCKHNFCSFCTKKLENNSKCPICRGEILTII